MKHNKPTPSKPLRLHRLTVRLLTREAVPKAAAGMQAPFPTDRNCASSQYPVGC